MGVGGLFWLFKLDIRESLDCFQHRRFVVLASKTIQKEEARTVLLKKVHVSVCLHLIRNNTVTFIFSNVWFSNISVYTLTKQLLWDY